MARKSRKNGTPKETKYTAEVAFRAFFDDILPKLPEAERRRAIDLVARVAMPELYKHLRQMSKDNYEAAKDNVQMAKDMMDFADRQGRGRKSQQDKAKERDELIDQLKREEIGETEIYNALLSEHFDLVKGQRTKKKKDATMTQAEVFRLWRRRRNRNHQS